MASMRELAMELLSRAGSGPVLQPTNVYGQDPDLPIGYGEGEISPLDAAAMSTMLVPGVGDVTGLAADVDMYMRDPESRNISNYLMTAAGLIPFIPAASQVRQGIKATKTDLTLDQKKIVVDEYAEKHPKAFAKIQKQVGKRNVEKQYAKVLNKKSLSEKFYQDRAAQKNLPKKKLLFIHDSNKTRNLLNKLGFKQVNTSVSNNFESGFDSISEYWQHPETKASVRVSDHAPVYSRSHSNVMIHPDSFGSNLEIEQALRSASKKET